MPGNYLGSSAPTPEEAQGLSPQASQRALGVCANVLDAGRVLIAYADGNREEARTAGVESIAIEMSGILEGGRLQQILGALQNAVERGRRPEITYEGFATLRRAERLMADAEAGLARFSGMRPFETAARLSGGACPHHGCGGRHLSGIGDIPVSLLLLGVVGAGAVLALVYLAITRNGGEEGRSGRRKR
jgi:hypothetical protein